MIPGGHDRPPGQGQGGRLTCAPFWTRFAQLTILNRIDSAKMLPAVVPLAEATERAAALAGTGRLAPHFPLIWLGRKKGRRLTTARFATQPPTPVVPAGEN